MQKYIGTSRSLSIACLLLLLGGCASEPQNPSMYDNVSGEQMMRDSEGMAQLSSRWKQGKQMVQRGRAMQHDGQAQIDQGTRLVEEGQKIMRESEEGYKNIKE